MSLYFILESHLFVAIFVCFVSKGIVLYTEDGMRNRVFKSDSLLYQIEYVSICYI